MAHILIEENYAHNNRIDQILQGMASIIKKKRIGVKLYTDISKLEKNARVVVLLCASLKWATGIILPMQAGRMRRGGTGKRNPDPGSILRKIRYLF